MRTDAQLDMADAGVQVPAMGPYRVFKGVVMVGFDRRAVPAA